MNNSLVIIPTYNEKENIETIIREILKQDLGFHILIVDDSSPDGTSDIVLQLSKEFPNQVNLLLREKKEGLGRAYISGFKWGLERNYEYLIEMDADFSHRPIDLKKHQQAWSGCDFCIGSRYVPGGRNCELGDFEENNLKGRKSLFTMDLGVSH
jgi:dolichol-phosphate mannosyltransferase